MTTQGPMERIDELAALEPGWSDGEGEKITRDSVSLAVVFASTLNTAVAQGFHIFPGENGSLQFELQEGARVVLGIELGPTENDILFWTFSLESDELDEEPMPNLSVLVERLGEALSQPAQ